MTKGATTGGSVGGGPDPPKFGRTTPTSYAAADCSARNWIYLPYFVMYNNLDQEIGPPTLKTWLRPCLWPWPLNLTESASMPYSIWPNIHSEYQFGFTGKIEWSGFVGVVGSDVIVLCLRRRHFTAKHIRFQYWIHIKTGFANPDSGSLTEWMDLLKIQQIEYGLRWTTTPNI